MKPRLETSKNWTAVPQDYVRQVLEVLHSNFKSDQVEGEFFFEGRIYAQELLVRLGFLAKGRLKQINFEISLQYQPGKDNVPDLLGLTVDAGANLLEEALRSEFADQFSPVWQEMIFEKRPLYIQYSGTNTKLEDEANRLLGMDSEGLVHEQESEEAEAKILEELKSQLGLVEDEEH